MAVDFSMDSPLAAHLKHLVQPKLAELGWTTGGDEDTTLFEYILLMLANDKNESQVAADLSNDLLDLGPENTETQQFAQWLFEQIEMLKQQLNGGNQQAEQTSDNSHNNAMQDTDMDGSHDLNQGSIPTGPKSMRNGGGNGAQSARPPRGGRMLNQMNRSMNRNDDPLRRVRGAGAGAGRIGSSSRDAQNSPRGHNVGRGIEAMANGRGMNNASMNMAPNLSGLPGIPQMGNNMNGMPNMLNPQQQMALMQMYEQQAQMMQQIFSGAGPAAFGNSNSNFNNNNRNGNGNGNGKKPLHQRMQHGNKGNNPAAKPFKPRKEGQDESMGDAPAEGGDSMEVESTRPDLSNTMCKFNLRCTNPDCPFVHQSPAAFPGTSVDMNDTCEYGAACKNKKCVGKHPSPAQRQKYQAEQECAFWPNCRDPANCPYKHPSTQPCRNGADCTKEGCTFAHSTIACKFNPCLNPRCIYKHAPGQKKNQSNVWVAPKEGEHVSERKFVDEEKQEELIIPGQTQASQAVDIQL